MNSLRDEEGTKTEKKEEGRMEVDEGRREK